MGWVVSVTPRPHYRRERPGTHCVRGWVSLRAGLDGCGKPRPYRDSIPGPFLAGSESLYRLSYPGSQVYYVYSITYIYIYICNRISISMIKAVSMHRIAKKSITVL